MVRRVPFTGDEKQSLHVSLDRHRDAVLWKLEGLADDDLRRPMTQSGTNLLGLVKHLAAVEYGWFCDTFGRPTEPLPFDDDDPDADLRVRADETTEDVLAFYARARAAAESPYVDPDPELAEVLIAGQRAGQAKIEELAKGGGDTPGGWTSALHLFDYNLDHLGLGTKDAPEWKLPDRAKAYVTRALAARAGLWGNHGYEACYAFVWTDEDGQPLHGANRYELRLESPPPVDAFWSLTMYDVPDFYLVANPIDRYSIGDRTPGLQTGPDGSVTVYLQSDSPGPDKEANWLPTPAGAFRPIMRMYQPQQPVLDGTYVLPAVRKVG
jgi:hypothetical protein